MHFSELLSLRQLLRKLLQTLALLLALGVPSLHAATALLLSTDEIKPDTISYMSAALDSLNKALGPTKVTDKRDALSNSATVSLSDADFQGQNIILLVTGYEAIDAARWAVVKNQLFTNPDAIFLFFVDGCCSSATNMEEVTKALDAATGLGLTTARYSNTFYVESLLNRNSPYSSDFESQPAISGLDAALISNVPSELALYLPPDASTLTPGAGERVDALGFLVPKALNHGGQGACSFVLADSNAFDWNAPLMIGNFVRAALNPNGACQLSFPHVDLSVSIAPTFSTPVNTTLTLPIEIRNRGGEAASGGKVHIELPMGVRVVEGNMPSSCVLQSGIQEDEPQELQCSVSALAPQATQTIALPVLGKAAGSFSLQLEVEALDVDGDLTNNRAASRIQIGNTIASPHSVPVNGLWFLLGLSSLMILGCANASRLRGH
ncbi:MAG: hypothetical protein RSD57_06840 [Comamonas sp.]